MPQRQASARSRHPVLRESTIAVDGLTVVVLRKNIVNMYLRVRPRGAMVVVSAPARVSEERIVALVRAKARWIAAQRSRLLDAETNGDVLVWTPDAEAASRRVIEERLPGLLSRWQPIVGRSPSAITIRRMTTRWGSCTPATGRIRLNLQLGLMDPKFLEYVLVHEMTHLWARGHGEGFQHLMDGWLPGWRDVRREMNRQWVLPPASPSPPR
ncbi:SprT family zinc-dependent metalloprotease [uncultured Bifidobacterium sp.]|uniref:M48 family metallopeptidase n=1 Tax=uncultured Bifidobacterium sp. TaxID=165187 RepID=UPI00260E1172|nr:SprT family zinc-dependent metalloprotease [uncultured Bifidobacterium sp.]